MEVAPFCHWPKEELHDLAWKRLQPWWPVSSKKDYVQRKRERLVKAQVEPSVPIETADGMPILRPTFSVRDFQRMKRPNDSEEE